MNLPNRLTVARCVMAILFVGLMSFQNWLFYCCAYLVFVVASITDYYDGKIARERNIVTNFGKLLDPVADKVLMLAAFIMLMQIDYLRIPGWTIVVILAREFLVTGARSLAAAEGSVIPANRWGKTKTVLQMIYAFTFLFFAVAFEVLRAIPAAADLLPGGLDAWVHAIGYASMGSITFVAAYTVYSGLQFARVNWVNLNLDKSI